MNEEPDTIVAAAQYPDWIALALHPETGDDYQYTLREDDPYGWAPALRTELQRMVDAGEIVIEPGTQAMSVDQNITGAPDNLTGGPTIEEVFNVHN